MEQPALWQRCMAKRHRLAHWKSRHPPMGGGGAGSVLADLVILIDTSASMADEAEQLNKILGAAVTTARQSCASDLRVEWLGIEDTHPNTEFRQTARGYLLKLDGVSPDDLRSRRRNTLRQQGAQEDGARAIMDITRHFNWRPSARRFILYLGDEALEGGDPADAADVAAARQAISLARKHGVAVFTYAGSWQHRDFPRPQTELSFRKLARETGGMAYTTPPRNLSQFGQDLARMLCAHDTADGGPVEQPELFPCFSLHWGDGPKDRIDTDDVEVICVEAFNPYRNVRFKAVTVEILEVKSATGGAIATLPDGSQSINLVPREALSFGDLEPWNPREPNVFSRVAREIMLIATGATPGPYQLQIRYSFSTEYLYPDSSDAFTVRLV